jgi:hypothetical protein
MMDFYTLARILIQAALTHEVVITDHYVDEYELDEDAWEEDDDGETEDEWDG